MKKLMFSVISSVFVLSTSFAAEKTLYEKPGGKQAIDTVVVELTNKMMKDLEL